MLSNLNQALYLQIKHLVHNILTLAKSNPFRSQLDKVTIEKLD